MPSLIAAGIQAACWRIAAVALSCRAAITERERFRLRVRYITTSEVALPETNSTVLPGTYWLKFPSGRWLMLGEVLERDGRIVLRRVVAGNAYSPKDARARLSGYGPREGATHQQVIPGSKWAVHVHGLGSELASLDRTVQAVRDAGYQSICLGSDPRIFHGFGIHEAKALTETISSLRAQGAHKVVAVGWSLGAIAILASLGSSARPDAFVGISPLLAWQDPIEHFCKSKRLPSSVVSMVLNVMSSRTYSWLFAQRNDIRNLLDGQPWKTGQVGVPGLLLHSSGDALISIDCTRAFAGRNRSIDLVELPPAPHTLEWNASVGGAEAEVARFLATIE